MVLTIKPVITRSLDLGYVLLDGGLIVGCIKIGVPLEICNDIFTSEIQFESNVVYGLLSLFVININF